MKLLSIVLLISLTLGCKWRVKYWRIPGNERQIVRLVMPEGESIQEIARMNGEGAIRIRIEIWSKNAEKSVLRINKLFNLNHYNSSSLTAHNLASSRTKDVMNIEGEWIPKNYSLVGGYTGDGISLARYDYTTQQKTILIVYARSESLLNPSK